MSSRVSSMACRRVLLFAGCLPPLERSPDGPATVRRCDHDHAHGNISTKTCGCHIVQIEPERSRYSFQADRARVEPWKPFRKHDGSGFPQPGACADCGKRSFLSAVFHRRIRMAMLIGLAASNGLCLFPRFESPTQSYAIIAGRTRFSISIS